MFGSLTATSVVGMGSAWAVPLLTPIEVVVGFAVTLIIANWVVRKFRGRKGGKGRKRGRR